MPNKPSLFQKGQLIEFKYKNKDWKNGEIVASNQQNIKIKIIKSINKFKTINIPKSKALSLVHINKTLKPSNIKYPSWIRYGTAVDIFYQDSNSEKQQRTTINFMKHTHN